MAGIGSAAGTGEAQRGTAVLSISDLCLCNRCMVVSTGQNVLAPESSFAGENSADSDILHQELACCKRQ